MSKNIWVLRTACAMSVCLLAGYASAQQDNMGDPMKSDMSMHDMIEDGMTKSEVMQHLGKPSRVETSAANHDIRWEYDKLDDGALAIDFGPDGKVENVTHDSEWQE